MFGLSLAMIPPTLANRTAQRIEARAVSPWSLRVSARLIKSLTDTPNGESACREVEVAMEKRAIVMAITFNLLIDFSLYQR